MSRCDVNRRAGASKTERPPIISGSSRPCLRMVALAEASRASIDCFALDSSVHGGSVMVSGAICQCKYLLGSGGSNHMSGMLNKRRSPIRPCFEGERSESETLHSHLLAPRYTFRANSVSESALDYEAVIVSLPRRRQATWQGQGVVLEITAVSRCPKTTEVTECCRHNLLKRRAPELYRVVGFISPTLMTRSTLTPSACIHCREQHGFPILADISPTMDGPHCFPCLPTLATQRLNVSPYMPL